MTPPPAMPLPAMERPTFSPCSKACPCWVGPVIGMRA
ncbi:hypothetical protein EMGBD4_08900 [Verrucomicrobiota bacterium]|nr:hypothetical protein EMGBD4_08900 [Verrucomicrobiota bacterium]